MTPTEFGEFLKDMRFSYELKLPDREISNFWYERIRHVPGEALHWIHDRILREYPDRFPKRFDAVVGSLFRDWLRATPDKRAPDDACPECDSGWVHIRQPAGEMYPAGTMHTMAYACGRCRASLRGVEKLTKSEAQQRGLLLEDEKAPFGSQCQRGPVNPQALVDQAASKFDARTDRRRRRAA